MKTKIICPFCAFENTFELEISYSTKQKFVCCDLDEGGCDKKFAVEWGFTPVTRVFKLEAVSA